MILGILIWVSIVFGSIFLLLLIIPFRVSISGCADDRKGLDYELALCWAFGFIRVIAVQGEPITIFILGLRIWRLSIESWKKQKKTKKKKESARAIVPWIKRHYQQIAKIIKQFIRAVFLKGHIVGWIGLPDPADTARIGLLCQPLHISKDRFKLSINCVYDQEIFKIDARVQITLIIGYLGLTALSQILKKDTRVMIRGLAQT